LGESPCTSDLRAEGSGLQKKEAIEVSDSGNSFEFVEEVDGGKIEGMGQGKADARAFL